MTDGNSLPAMLAMQVELAQIIHQRHMQGRPFVVASVYFGNNFADRVRIVSDFASCSFLTTAGSISDDFTVPFATASSNAMARASERSRPVNASDRFVPVKCASAATRA